MGCSPVGQRPMIRPSPVSITATEDSPQRLTYARPLRSSHTTSSGSASATSSRPPRTSFGAPESADGRGAALALAFNWAVHSARTGRQVDPHHAAVIGERHHGRAEVAREREPGDDAPVRLVHDLHVAPRGEAAALEREDVQDPVARAAADKGLAVRRDGDAAEGLVEGRGGHDPPGRQVDDPDLVLAVARVKNGGQPSVGIDRHVDREVAQGDLGTDRMDRPLVVQQRVSVGLQAGKRALGAARRRNHPRQHDCRTPSRLRAGRAPRSSPGSPRPWPAGRRPP